MASAFRTGALAFVGLRLGLGVGRMVVSTKVVRSTTPLVQFLDFVRLLAFAGLLVSVARNFALFAALRSARVNLRPVCGQ